MPKLYYTTTSCSASAFIAAYANFVNLDVEQVDLRTHKTASGADFYKINPKGNVPALVFDHGLVLNENVAVLQWIADVSQGKIAPSNNTEGRYILQGALNYIASEIHPAIGIFFTPNLEEPVKTFLQGKLATKLAYLENHFIGTQSFVANGTKSIADYYLYVCLTWTGYVGVDLSPYVNIKAYMQRIAALEEVQEATKRMALNPPRVLAQEFYQVNCVIN